MPINWDNMFDTMDERFAANPLRPTKTDFTPITAADPAETVGRARGLGKEGVGRARPWRNGGSVARMHGPIEQIPTGARMGPMEATVATATRFEEGYPTYWDKPGAVSRNPLDAAFDRRYHADLKAARAAPPGPTSGRFQGPTARVARGIEKTSTRYAGVRAGMYRTVFPQEADALRLKLLDQVPKGGEQTWREMMAANPENSKQLGKDFASSFRRGGDKMFSPSTGKRLMGGMGKVAGNIAAETAGAAWRIGDTASHALLNTPLRNVAIGGAAIAGLTYMAGNALGVTREQTREAARTANSFVKDMYRPSYGSSEMGQSTSGLVQGLNNRRTSR